MRLLRSKTKYILRTEYDADGVWTKATVGDVFDRNPNITAAHAVFASYSWVEELQWYGSPKFRRCAFRLALYKQRGSRMRLIQVEKIPPDHSVDLTNVEWPRP